MVNIYDYENSKLYLPYGDKAIFDLSIRKPITIVSGNSASGKTLLVSCIKSTILNMKRNNKGSVPNIVAFDDEFSISKVETLPNSLIVIDRAELILNDEDVKYIREDNKHHYLIFARGFLDLDLTPNYFGEFIKEGSVITISYDFSEECWF